MGRILMMELYDRITLGGLECFEFFHKPQTNIASMVFCTIGYQPIYPMKIIVNHKTVNYLYSKNLKEKHVFEIFIIMRIGGPLKRLTNSHLEMLLTFFKKKKKKSLRQSPIFIKTIFIKSQLQSSVKYILKNIKIKPNWTRPKNFDICFCVIFQT